MLATCCKPTNVKSRVVYYGDKSTRHRPTLNTNDTTLNYIASRVIQNVFLARDVYITSRAKNTF